jgi:hypothetical protein
MPIELSCTGCGQTLRVGDEHVGKKARCPKCGTISNVPAAGESPPPASRQAAPFDTDKPAAEAANPFADLPEPTVNPYQSPSGSVGVRPSRYYRPHRGGMILTFGILGFVCCGIFGIVAWAMGAGDLKEIRAGRMDPAGQGLTQAGMILGIITTILMIVWGLFYVIMIAASAA